MSGKAANQMDWSVNNAFKTFKGTANKNWSLIHAQVDAFGVYSLWELYISCHLSLMLLGNDYFDY